MEFRYLGNSGLRISEVTYGNWLTHGSQVENDVAATCVRAALDAGITSFDTADVYANTVAESVLGDALKGERRESLEIFTKVFWPTGPKGPNDSGLSRKHIMESINGSLQRLQTDYVDLYQAHRYDPVTPLEETMQAFADVVRQGKALYIGVSEWTAEQITAGAAMAKELGFQLISSQPQYSMLWRVIEDEVVPASREAGVSQIVWSPIAQGVLTGKYQPGQPPPEGSRATDEKGGASTITRFMTDETLTAVQRLKPIAESVDLSMSQLAVAWVLQNDNVASAIVGASRPEQVHENVGAVGVKLPAETLAARSTTHWAASWSATPARPRRTPPRNARSEPLSVDRCRGARRAPRHRHGARRAVAPRGPHGDRRVPAGPRQGRAVRGPRDRAG
ncbi:aldo/keto reductase family protein [Nocardioides daphniae]|uniref:aldo/keto reductase family protein n=1 Tax=Nocardioides daphniae TaxID=402297 RepID=UPI001EE9A987|nr:aldo/keto reductase family protein [Nocardioides daphniae]